MKRFRFPLEALRSVRQHQEERAQERYAAALQASETAASSLRAAHGELGHCWAALGERLAAGVSASELAGARSWCDVLEARVKERAVLLEKARQFVKTTWEALVTATRQREAIDQFYHRQQGAYDRQVQRADQKQLDEIALQLGRSELSLHAHAMSRGDSL